MIEGLIVGLAVTVVGALIAGLFGYRQITRAHQLERAALAEQERQTAERVRTMLVLEFDQNYAALEKYDAGIDERVLFQNNAWQPKERAQQLSETPLPTWKHDYWDGLTASIPMALTPEEIKKCHEFHSTLDELTRLAGFPRAVQGTWHMCMEQAIAKLKELKSPLRQPDAITKPSTE